MTALIKQGDRHEFMQVHIHRIEGVIFVYAWGIKWVHKQGSYPQSWMSPVDTYMYPILFIHKYLFILFIYYGPIERGYFEPLFLYLIFF